MNPKHLIEPPQFSEVTPLMVTAMQVEIETFLRCGGVITLSDWCAMPMELRDAAIKASACVADEATKATREVLDRMEAATRKGAA